MYLSFTRVYKACCETVQIIIIALYNYCQMNSYWCKSVRSRYSYTGINTTVGRCSSSGRGSLFLLACDEWLGRYCRRSVGRWSSARDDCSGCSDGRSIGGCKGCLRQADKASLSLGRVDLIVLRWCPLLSGFKACDAVRCGVPSGESLGLMSVRLIVSLSVCVLVGRNVSYV